MLKDKESSPFWPAEPGVRDHLLTAALAYWDEGLDPIPLRPESKVAAVRWKRWQRERPSRAQVEQWWTATPEANIGLLTGRQKALLVIDVDTQDGWWALTDYIYGLQILRVKTGRGAHLYFAHPDFDLRSLSRSIP